MIDTDSRRAVSGAERRDYREKGFAKFAAFLSIALTQKLRVDLDAYAIANVVPSHYGLIGHNPWQHLPSLREVMDRFVAPFVLDLLACDEIVLFQDVLICKPPGTGQAVQWHQDYSYWPLDSAAGVTLWIALDRADPDNGCLRYIPGTHRLGERQPADFFVGTAQPVLPDLPPLEAAAHQSEVVDMPCRPGDLLAHHALTWHMSPANLSDRPRHAWSLSWISTETRWAPDHAPHPFNYYLQPVPGERVVGDHFPRFRRSS